MIYVTSDTANKTFVTWAQVVRALQKNGIYGTATLKGINKKEEVVHGKV